MAINTSTTLGQLLVRLVMDTKQFGESTKKAESDIVKLGSFFDRLGSSLSTTVVGGLAAASAAIAGMAAGSAVLGANFENTIAKVGAIAGASSEELKTLSTAAREIGKATAFTAQEAASAMTDLAQAGFKVQDIVNASKSAVLLAGATGSSMESATSLLAASMSQFQLSSTDTARVADVFSKAMNSTLFDMSSLTEAMKYAGVTGAGLGYTIEETTAAVAQFRNLGLEGSLAGTAFKMAMAEAAKQTGTSERALAKYNLTFKDINPEVKSFAEIMETVGKAGITTTDSMVIFGSRAGAAVAQVASTFANGSTTFYRTLDDLNNAAGTTQTTYDKMMNTVMGQWQIAASAMQELMLVLFDQYQEPLTNLLRTLGETIAYVAAAFSTHTGSMKSGLRGMFDTWAVWLKENRANMVVWFTMIANLTTKAITLFATLLPWLVRIGAMVASIFIATTVYKFATALGVAWSAIKALTLALAEAAAAGTIATGGLLPIAAAISAAVLAMGAFVVAMGEAEAAADRLREAEEKVATKIEAATAKMVARYEQTLPMQQAWIRQQMIEKSATGELTDAERERYDQLLKLTAAEAAQAVSRGELVDVSGDLIEVGALVEEQGNKGVELIDKQIAADRERALSLREQAIEAKGLADRAEFMSGPIAGVKSPLGFASIEDARAHAQMLLDMAEDADNKAKNLEDQKVNAIAKLQQEAMSDAKRNRAEEMQDIEAAGKEEMNKRREASEKRIELERQIAAEVAAIGRGELGEFQVTLQKRLASIARTFDDEIALWGAASAVGLELERRKLAAIADARRIAAANQKKENDAADLERANALADLTKTEEDRAKEVVDQKIKAINEAFDAEISAYDAGTAEIMDAERRRTAAIASVRSAAEVQALQDRLEIWRDNEEAIAGLRVSMERDAGGELTGIRLDEEAFFADNAKMTAEQVAAARAIFAKRASDAEIAASRRAQAYLKGGLKESERLAAERADFMITMEGATQEEIAKVNRKYDQQIWQAKIGEAVASLKEIGAVGVAAVTGIADAWDTVITKVSGLLEQFSGVSIGLNTVAGAMTDLVDEQATAAEEGTEFDPEAAAEAAANTLVEDGIALIEMWVAAAPVFIEKLVEALPGLIQSLLDALPVLIQALVDALPTLLQAVIDAIPVIAEAIIDAIPLILDAFLDALPQLITVIMALIEDLIEAIPGIVKQIMDALPGILESFLQALPGIIKAIALAIPEIISAILDALPDILTVIIQAIPDIIVAFIEAIPPMIPKIIQAIASAIPAIVAVFVTEIIAKLPEIVIQLVTALIESIWQSIKDFAAMIMEAAKEFFVKLGEILNPFDDSGERNKDDFTDLGNGDYYDNKTKEIISEQEYINRTTDQAGQALGKWKSGAWAWSGMDYVPATMRVTVHPGEAIVPAHRNRGRTGTADPPAPPLPASRTGGGDTRIGVFIGERLVDQVTVSAMDRGHAPRLLDRIRKAGGVVKGFDPGRFSAWSKA